jgi:steroid delta-isomerase-like uncharacterized protein
MPAEENRAVIRRAYEEMWNERNVDAVDELVTGDFLNHPAINQQRRGRQNLKEVIRIFEKAFPDFRYELEDIVAEGDKVAVRDVFTGTHEGDFMGIPATGNHVTMQTIHIYRFEGGRIAEHWAVRDEMGMMRQLGVVAGT